MVQLERVSFVLIVFAHVDHFSVGGEQRVAVIHCLPEGVGVEPAQEAVEHLPHRVAGFFRAVGEPVVGLVVQLLAEGGVVDDR